MKVICPKECQERIAQGESIEIIDIREHYEYEFCNIGSRHIPMAEVMDHAEELSAVTNLVIMCRTGKRAEAVANLLECETSMEEVLILEGGLTGWKEKVDPSLNIE